MKLMNVCFIIQTEEGRRFCNVNVTTQKRLTERIQMHKGCQECIYAKVRYEELYSGEYRVIKTREFINKLQ